MNRIILLLVAVISWIGSGSSNASAADPAQIEFFEQKIRPVLVEKCYSCHSGSPEEVEAKLWLDSRAGLLRGGKSGPVVVAGKPDQSLLLDALRGTEKNLAMPPDEKLAATVIADFETWIRNGAVDPREGNSAGDVHSPLGNFTERDKWTYSKPVKPSLPNVQDQAWVRQPVDSFILTRLEAASLSPAVPATPEQLVRRLHFDLNGLPPTPEEVKAFVQESAVDQQRAVEKLVNDLLRRPAYGEKWGRAWLDCVRYADSLDARSGSRPGDILDAWRYRDWVVNALNRDMPYGEFVRAQIAGDLLARQQSDWNPDLVVATGVYAIGNWGNGDSDKKKVHTDIVDDQIDVTTRAFLGITLACARCHDHKFDPLSTADYYAMAGFFFSSRIIEKFNAPTAGESLMRIDLLSPAEQKKRQEIQSQIAELEQALQQKMTPLVRRINDVAGRSELVSWVPEKQPHPSLTINRGESVQQFSTLTMPGKSICFHPSPTEPITAVWISPVAGDVELTAVLHDIDGSCGDGIAWSVEAGERILEKGDLANGSPVKQVSLKTTVEAGEIVRLVISPRSSYVCDSTRAEMTVTHMASGQSWNLTEAMLPADAVPNNEKAAFLICSGNAPRLNGDPVERERLLADVAKLKKQLPEEVRCQGLQDGGIPGTPYEGFHDAPIHVRGNYNRLATEQPRGFPAVFQTPTPKIEGSGRLALADWVASSENPLTARVMMNRLWQHHFGRGIVATANNFGRFGTPPTHPELLDWLAVTFIERNGSLKEMHRLICTSAAYQQSSQPSAETLASDPDNLLFSRQTRRKLTAEELRDSMFFVTGELDPTVGGMPVDGVASPRRTLYLKTVRSDRTSYQLLFDGADPNSIVEQRNESLVAPQALWLLNQPVTLQRAERLLERVKATPGMQVEARLHQLMQLLFGRQADAQELEIFQASFASEGNTDRSWLTVCHLLLCSNEMMFVD